MPDGCPCGCNRNPTVDVRCICRGFDMGNENFDLDVRPDCPVHGENAPYDPVASDIGEDPF